MAHFPAPFDFCACVAEYEQVSAIASNARALLEDLNYDERDYAISCAYAHLIGAERRKRLSAYFTPPALSAAVIDAAAPFFTGSDCTSVLDPACGGGSFLVPAARRLIATLRARGLGPREACALVVGRVRGIEVDAGLAALSVKLLAGMLRREHGVRLDDGICGMVSQSDAFSLEPRQIYDLVLGNPPYGRIGRAADLRMLADAGRAGLGGHTNLYALFLLRALRWVKPGGGLVFVLPTSFVAGPYFAGLREEVLSRAEVLCIDLHEQRENLFVNAVQDVCLLALRRREGVAARSADATCTYELGLIDAEGRRKALDTAKASLGGEPWMLPVPIRGGSRLRGAGSKSGRAFVLADYGYRARVGKVVPTRERKRLREAQGRASLPLVWASDIRPDGTFAFGGSRRPGIATWYDAPRNISYATRGPAVLIQRTSNRDQRRRLYAAAVPTSFLDQCHECGFVAENHVIVLEASGSRPTIAPATLAALFNSGPVNERFSAVAGSFSVSAKLLSRLALPDPAFVPAKVDAEFEDILRALFGDLESVLAPSEAAGDPKHTADQPSNLEGRASVDEDTCLKRGAVA